MKIQPFYADKNTGKLQTSWLESVMRLLPRTKLTALVAAILASGLRVGAACAQSIVLGFPAADLTTKTPFNPYTAPVVSVLDHQAAGGFYIQNSNTSLVEAYTGETGQRSYNGCGPSGEPCGYYNQALAPFHVNGNYTGTSADGGDAKKVLNYRGHSGYDYGYNSSTAVTVAAADGTLYIPARDPVNDSGGSDPWCAWHTFYIDHGNGWSTWYLHSDHLLIGSQRSCPGPGISADELMGPVTRGQPVGVIGNFGVVSPHLHFEVRRGCERSNGKIVNCKVVDPYGWLWPDADPLGYTNSLATTQAAPLWDPALSPPLPVINSVNLSGSTVTISGLGFQTGALIGLWSRAGQYFSAAVLPSSVIPPTQIVADISAQLGSQNPSSFVLTIQNPQGPRSVGKVLSVATAVASVPLALAGKSAPGGGTFVSFGNFFSLANSGNLLFTAQIDLNADGIADETDYFSSIGGQQSKVTVAGFSKVSPVLINNNGDMAFGDASNPGITQAIYFLAAANINPVMAVQTGEACPSPCPVNPSSTVYNLTGPFSLTDAKFATFYTSLLDPSTHVAACCYLYRYSSSDGSLIKVVGSGDAAPTGGNFAPQTWEGNQITSDGDVVFRAQLSDGSHGIFRFSPGQGISKIVMHGDPVPSPPGGTINFPTLSYPSRSVVGRQLIFDSTITGGASDEAILYKKDVTSTSLSDLSVIAYQGESTNSAVGGSFSVSGGTPGNNFPFIFGFSGGFSSLQSGGGVVFGSVLSGATTTLGSPTTQGVFVWTGRGMSKIAVDGDVLSSGATVFGPASPITNDVGQVEYFVSKIQ